MLVAMRKCVVIVVLAVMDCCCALTGTDWQPLLGPDSVSSAGWHVAQFAVCQVVAAAICCNVTCYLQGLLITYHLPALTSDSLTSDSECIMPWQDHNNMIKAAAFVLQFSIRYFWL